MTCRTRWLHATPRDGAREPPTLKIAARAAPRENAPRSKSRLAKPSSRVLFNEQSAANPQNRLRGSDQGKLEMLKLLPQIRPQSELRRVLLMPKMRGQKARASEAAEAEPALAADARKNARG
jgi:hypothetical protein